MEEGGMGIWQLVRAFTGRRNLECGSISFWRAFPEACLSIFKVSVHTTHCTVRTRIGQRCTLHIRIVEDADAANRALIAQLLEQMEDDHPNAPLVSVHTTHYTVRTRIGQRCTLHIRIVEDADAANRALIAQLLEQMEDDDPNAPL
ncbi:hypothetical protein ACFE04_000035 [Oxalis oulophora]